MLYVFILQTKYTCTIYMTFWNCGQYLVKDTAMESSFITMDS